MSIFFPFMCNIFLLKISKNETKGLGLVDARFTFYVACYIFMRAYKPLL